MTDESLHNDWSLRYGVASASPGLGGPQYDRNAAYAGPHLLAVARGLHDLSVPASPANIAVDELRRVDTGSDPEDVVARAARARSGLEETFRQLMTSDPRWADATTMLAAVLWCGSRAAIAHIGDSRVYLLRDGDLIQLTRDHTVGRLLVEDGLIAPEELGSDPRHSLIVGWLGAGEPSRATIETAPHQAKLGDRYLLAMSGSQDIGHVDALYDLSADPQDVAGALIASASFDNVTVIVADVVDDQLASGQAAVKRACPWMDIQSGYQDMA